MKVIELNLTIELNEDEFKKFILISSEVFHLTTSDWSYKPVSIMAVTVTVGDDGIIKYNVKAGLGLVERLGKLELLVNDAPAFIAKMAETLAKILSL